MVLATYLQIPENLRLAAGLEVLQSLGPEAVLLVQGAVAARRADESTTTQEPQGESSPAASGAAAASKSKGFPARRAPPKILSDALESYAQSARLRRSLLKSSTLRKSPQKKLKKKNKKKEQETKSM